jgi:hypothetical protein
VRQVVWRIDRGSRRGHKALALCCLLKPQYSLHASDFTVIAVAILDPQIGCGSPGHLRRIQG